MCGRLLWRTQDNRRTVHIIASEHPDSAFSQTVIGHYRKKRTVYPQIGKSQGYIRLTAAVTGVETCRHPDFLIIGGCQPKHNFPDCDKFMKIIILFQ